MTETTFRNKCEILGELWINYRDDEQFEALIEYNDLALPLAYAVSSQVIEPNVAVERFVNEAWGWLLQNLGVDDTGWETFEDLLNATD